MPLYDNLGYASEKIAVIFDIGAAFTKCGFAGESSPRCIVPSVVKLSKTGQVVKVHGCTKADELYAVLLDFVHTLYFRHVLVNPKERRVVIVESVLTTSVFRETLARVLFQHYEVPSVLFAPSHLMALFTLGVPSALVMDAGYTETLVLPIYEGVPIIKGCQSLPLAGRAIHSYLEAQIKESATVQESREEAKPLSSVKESLEESVLEDIKVKCCFVTKYERAKQIHESTDTEAPAPPPDVDYPMDGQIVLKVPGKIRERTYEVLFERDLEEKSIATLILDSILQCPVDMRKTLAENLLVIGGTAMSLGFRHRIKLELEHLVTQAPYGQLLAIKTFKFHSAPAKENFTAWLGGAIFGALEILASRSISRDKFKHNNYKLPDWCSMFEMEEKDDRPAALAQKETPKEKSPTAALKTEQSTEGTVASKGT